VPAEDLRAAAGAGTPESLKVPQWAIQPVTKMGTDHRRLEGSDRARHLERRPGGIACRHPPALIDASAAK